MELPEQHDIVDPVVEVLVPNAASICATTLGYHGVAREMNRVASKLDSPAQIEVVAAAQQFVEAGHCIKRASRDAEIARHTPRQESIEVGPRASRSPARADGPNGD